MIDHPIRLERKLKSIEDKLDNLIQKTPALKVDRTKGIKSLCVEDLCGSGWFGGWPGNDRRRR